MSACAKRHPDPAGQLERVIADLNARPLTAPGKPGAPVLTAGVAATSLYSLYYEALGYAQVPNLIAQLAKRDPKLLQGGDDDEESSGLEINAGQFFSVECAEELAGLTPDALRANAAPFGAEARELVETNVQIGVGAPQICAAFGVPATRAKPADLKPRQAGGPQTHPPPDPGGHRRA